jgi:maltose O-acetyltransferase
MEFRRIKQVCEYGWKDAQTLSQEADATKGRLSIFLDILHCFFKYNVWSNQYKKEKLHLLSGEQKREICLKYQEKNNFRDQWVKEFFDNYKFLNKWSSFKYERSANLQAKRRAAYKKQYGLGENCFVGYDVILHKHHYKDSKIVTGKDCLLAEQVNIDYTGGLVLGNKVSISEGAKILTHNHVVDFSGKDEDKGCILTPLVIHDRVWIGTKAMIMPGVKEIGRGAMISSLAYVHTKIPPYAIVMGNPAKIVGFRLTPEEIIEFEKNNYSEENRLPEEVINNNYKKYFQSRWKELKEFSRV